MNDPRIHRQAGERGQTIILVGLCLLVLLAFAALAIDITTLYVARSQAQQAADAAALAGAQAFVSSGYTSGFVTQTAARTLATQQATAAGQQVNVGGRNLLLSEITVTFPTLPSGASNPLISVAVARAEVPTFFAKIWGVTSTTVSATAKAEAYNPSGLGSSSPNIQTASLKPFAIANCNPNAASGPGLPQSVCSSSFEPFFDPSNNYSVVSPDLVVGQWLQLNQLASGTAPTPGDYYVINLPISSSSVSCPSINNTSCDSVNPGLPGLYESIACYNSVRLACNNTFTVDATTGGAAATITSNAGMCLIHASSPGLGNGQDTFCGNSVPCSSAPIQIDGGHNNPDPSLKSVSNISRSDSVITVPVWNGSNLCPGGTCSTGTVIGFLQLGIQRIRTSPGTIATIILNAVGCGSAPTTNVVSASTASPVLVRLVNWETPNQ